ncbi:RHS repeat domain-containing protein [Blastopirellula marina]|uniref:Uncharacterized protein n=1 Tax=Blastopirellula marina TaxID=124 RepID=A0A2S8GH78_9BACT|nr:RHS repeat-associated core domain-containing protein [Blastopirellula marina]PQO43816.1 hypothetical protein C5Y93_21760 [Blastopirellula marina]
MNEVQFAYNDFGQLVTDYQAHGSAVNTSTTPKVQDGYTDGSANTIRLTSMTYPNGRVLTYDYGAASGVNDSVSRIASLVDDDGSSTHLVDYSYLGLRSFVIADYKRPETKWTLAELSGANDPDTGDIYSGLDRFGRVKDNRWYDYGSSSDTDRIKYGYDRRSNRIWRQNVVADALSKPFDELYDYDDVYRLKEMSRGMLNANKDAISSESFAQCWSLDETGNWKKFLEDSNGDGTWDLNQGRAANQVNEITNITETTGPSWATPTYNPAGNMSTIPQPNNLTSSYVATWDAWNRLVKLIDGANTVAGYEYDGAKRCVIVKTFLSGSLNETRHVYFTDPAKWQAIEVRVNSSSVPHSRHVWGLRYIDDLVLRDRDTDGNDSLDERLYAMQDANWNVTVLTNVTGDVQQRFVYCLFGQSEALSQDFTHYMGADLYWQYQFTAREIDLNTGLQVNRNRYFHQQIGGWCSRDPLRYSDGMNQYSASFVPNYVDPMGLFRWPSFLCNQCEAGDSELPRITGMDLQKTSIYADPSAGDEAVYLLALVEVMQKTANAADIINGQLTDDLVSQVAAVIDANGMPSSKDAIEGIRKIWEGLRNNNRYDVTIWIQVNIRCCTSRWPLGNYWSDKRQWYRCDGGGIFAMPVDFNNNRFKEQLQACKRKAAESLTCD